MTLHAPRTLDWLVTLAVLLTAGFARGETPDRLKVTYTERIRIETSDNVSYFDYDSLAGSSYMRSRTGLMFQFRPSQGWELATRLTNEFRYYFVPERRRFTLDEVIVDQLYVQRDSAFDMPLTVIVGRQNISLGEGFIVAEGGPLDGSRTVYFNAINLRYDFAPDHSLSLIFMHQPRVDEWLPIIHDQNRTMVEQREQAVVAYYSQKGLRLSPQAYAVYKHLGQHGSRASADIICVGGRLQAAFTGKLGSTTELALQRGNWGEFDHSAFGGYSYFELKTGWPQYYPQSFTLGGLYLSGNDPVTDDHEGWEPMFSRFPKWSESYAYSLVREYGSAYWSNLASVFARTSMSLGADVTLSLDYHHLLAPEHANPAADFPGGSGRDRGNLFIGKLAYRASPHLTGHVIWESFEPGDYYAMTDHSSWMRMEALLTY